MVQSIARRFLLACFVISSVVAMAAMLTSCSRTATNTTYSDDFDQFGDRSKSMQAEARLMTRKGEGELEAARALIADNKFRDGIPKLERLIADRSNDAEIREDAMLMVAEAHGSWLNPFRDYDKALYWCQQLLSEFPETDQRSHVERLMEQYREAADGQS